MSERAAYILFGHKPPKEQGYCARIYMVFLSTNVSSNKQPHESLLGVKVTRRAAERIRDAYPGSYIVGAYAAKT